MNCSRARLLPAEYVTPAIRAAAVDRQAIEPRARGCPECATQHRSTQPDLDSINYADVLQPSPELSGEPEPGDCETSADLLTSQGVARRSNGCRTMI